MTKKISKAMQKDMIVRIENMFNILGAEYRFIIDDKIYTNIVEEEKARKSPRKYPVGVVTKYLDQFAKNLQPGESVQIPLGEFDGKFLRSNVASYGSAKFGKGNSMTKSCLFEGFIELARIG